ncbi:hypothetical protein O181_118777 [Austropuccinia psidii MF-1]|uniref:Uncharacterized protein n=1 Tax=Austropuccinia psidii MF-1 TaxID=1389203 RepID=A0A9Q3KFZ0_9BASI|nr:hypothetical protein [Austropuccinia psidii MF-1]
MVCGPWTVRCGPWAVGAIGGLQDQNGPPGDHKLAHGPIFHLHGLDSLREVQDHQYYGLPKVSGEVQVMSSKLTELTESSPSATPPSVLCGSGVLSQLASPSMASSGHFDPSQTYGGYKAVKALDPACTECLAKGKDCFQHYMPRSSNFYYCFIGKKPCHHTSVQA